MDTSIWTLRMLSILRIMSSLLLMEHGTQKLLGFPPAEWQPELLSLLGFAGVLEMFGGFLLLIGLFTRPAAFVLSGFAAAAYFIGHASKSFFPMLNDGDAAILYCFVFLYLVFAGGGAWSLDAWRRRAASSAA